jgi:hypothetical protein
MIKLFENIKYSNFILSFLEISALGSLLALSELVCDDC